MATASGQIELPQVLTETEIRGGFDLESLIGSACLLNVVHVARDGATFANVSSIMRLPKGMNALQPRDYVRVKDRQEQNGSSSMAEEAPPEMDEDDEPEN